MYNFKNVKILDIEWNILKDWDKDLDISKNLANMIYQQSKSIWLVDIALNIYNWRDVEFTEEQIKELKEIIEAGFTWVAKKFIFEYLDSNS